MPDGCPRSHGSYRLKFLKRGYRRDCAGLGRSTIEVTEAIFGYLEFRLWLMKDFVFVSPHEFPGGRYHGGMQGLGFQGLRIEGLGFIELYRKQGMQNRQSSSNLSRGIITFEHRAFNQNGQADISSFGKTGVGSKWFLISLPATPT